MPFILYNSVPRQTLPISRICTNSMGSVLQKLTVAQPVTKFPALYRTPSFIIMLKEPFPAHRSVAGRSFPITLKYILIMYVYLHKIHLINLLHSGFQTKISVSRLLHTGCMYEVFYYPLSYHPNNIDFGVLCCNTAVSRVVTIISQ
jgi:hypothetical protein